MHDRFILLKHRHDLSEHEDILLVTWTAALPLLGAAYRVKEEFHDIWGSADRNEALERLGTWRTGVPEELRPAFKPILTALANSENEMLAYFGKHRITNGYTEAMNGVAKVVNRMGRGYSFDVIRAKLLYSRKVHVRVRLADQRTEDMLGMTLELMVKPPRYGHRLVNFGAHIPALIRMIEEEEC